MGENFQQKLAIQIDHLPEHKGRSIRRKSEFKKTFRNIYLQELQSVFDHPQMPDLQMPDLQVPDEQMPDLQMSSKHLNFKNKQF